MKLTKFAHRMAIRLIAFYPPFLFSGIGVKRLSLSPLSYRTTLKRRWWNQNAVGTHFGGSLFSMTDPFIMLVLMAELGSEYIIWDKESSIEFRIATKDAVSATHSISKEQIEEIRQTCEESPIYPQFTIDISDARGEIVARVNKTLYVKKRPLLSDSTSGGV